MMDYGSPYFCEESQLMHSNTDYSLAKKAHVQTDIWNDMFRPRFCGHEVVACFKEEYDFIF